MSKTNRQVLAKLVREADEMTLVYMRERLVSISTVYVETDTKDLRKEFAEVGMAGFVSVYQNGAREVLAHLEVK